MKEGRIAGPARPSAISFREATAAFKGFFSIARLVGLDSNQAALAASRGVKNEIGVDPLASMGITHFLAPQQEPDVNATQAGAKVAERIGGTVSAIAANRLLEKYGFQVKDANVDSGWMDTEKGKPFAVWKDTAKKHSDGTSVRQLRWAVGVVGALVSSLSEAADAQEGRA